MKVRKQSAKATQKEKKRPKYEKDQIGAGLFESNKKGASSRGHAFRKKKEGTQRKTTDAFYFVVAVRCSAMFIPSQRRSVGR